MNFSKTLLATSITIAALGLTACGGSDQDSGSDTRTSFTGLVIDGYIAYGTVWIDANGNNAKDAYEDSASTDSQGYFTFNPRTGVNYCADADSVLYAYCLKSGQAETTATIKIKGGTDLSTGKAFPGVMTYEVSRSKASTDYSSLVNAFSGNPVSGATEEAQLASLLPLLTPLTTLLAKLSSDDATSQMDILVKLGIARTDLTGSTDQERIDNLLQNNYVLGSSDGTASSKTLFKAATKVQKAVDSIAANLDGAAKSKSVTLGSDGKPESSADDVWDALATNIATSTDFQDALDDTSTAAISSFATKAGITFSGSEQTDLGTRSTSHATEMDNVLEANMIVTEDFDDLVKAVKSTAIVLKKIEAVATTISSASGGVDDLSTLVKNTGFIDSFKSETSDIDIDELADQVITLATTQTTMNAGEYSTAKTAAEIATVNATGFWPNTRVLMGKTGTGSESSGKIAMYFSPPESDPTNTAATQGLLTVCLRYDENNDGLYTGTDDLNGKFLTGTWGQASTTNAGEINAKVSGYEMSMKLKALVGGKGEILFRYLTDSGTWTTSEDSVSRTIGSSTVDSYGVNAFTGTVPKTDAACATQLSSS